MRDLPESSRTLLASLEQRWWLADRSGDAEARASVLRDMAALSRKAANQWHWWADAVRAAELALDRAQDIQSAWDDIENYADEFLEKHERPDERSTRIRAEMDRRKELAEAERQTRRDNAQYGEEAGLDRPAAE